MICSPERYRVGENMGLVFFPIDAVALGGNNHMLAVSGPEFSCALLQVNTLGWRYGVIFFPFFSFSVDTGFFTKQRLLQS